MAVNGSKVEAPLIRPGMTVREINARYPACRQVFARHGMGGCGGELGPDEPLDFFARAHNVAFSELAAELELAARGHQDVPDTISPALDFERRLARLCKAFIRAAIGVTLSFGTTWGVYILLRISLHQSYQAPNYAGTQAHGHAQVFGWVGLFIMGVAYFSIPKFMNARLRTLVPGWSVLLLVLTSILLRGLAQPLATRPWYGGLVVASTILGLLAATIFAFDLGSVFVRGKRFLQPYHTFIQASLTWLLVVAGWTVVLAVAMFHRHTNVIPDPTNAKYLHLAIFGFIVNMILGYSLRVLPIFLGLRPVRERLVVPAFALWNLGLLARLLGWPLVSGLLGFAGMAVYVFALRIFEPPTSYVKSRGIDRIFPAFIRVAYVWFVVSVAMVLGGHLYESLTGHLPAHVYIASWRHAVTVGFITTIMVGLGYRMLPLFMGVDLWRPDWMRASFGLLLAGNTLRVVFELATASGQRWTYFVMGASGVMELTALALFSISIWMTFGRRQQVLVTQDQISPQTHVRWLLDNFPEARQQLIRLGFIHLSKVSSVPSFVTLAQAARIHGVDVDAVVEELRSNFRPARAV